MSGAAWFWISCAVIVVWVVRAYFWPFAKCGWCDGSGKRHMGKRFGNCWRCKGSGRRQVKGSKQVHQAVRAVRGRSWK
jgi:DnaJ-class molecular chaperone